MSALMDPNDSAGSSPAADSAAFPAVSNITSLEASNLLEIRALLSPLFSPSSTLPGSVQARLHSDDGTLLRFIAARGTVKESAVMFSETMVWRETVDVPEIHRSHTNPTDPAIVKAMETWYGLVLTGVDSRSNSGGPVMIELIGSVDLAGVAKHDLGPALCDCYIHYLETTWLAVRRGEGGRQKSLVIVDLFGGTFDQLRYISIIKHLAAIGSARYPEVVETIALCRGPWAVSAAWKILSPLLPAATRAKVKILGPDYLERLRALAPERVIPSSMGGSCFVGDEEGAVDGGELKRRALKVER